MFKKIESIIIVCDGIECKEVFTASNEFSIFTDQSGAEMAFNDGDDGWYGDDDKHFCPRHVVDQ